MNDKTDENVQETEQEESKSKEEMKNEIFDQILHEGRMSTGVFLNKMHEVVEGDGKELVDEYVRFMAMFCASAARNAFVGYDDMEIFLDRVNEGAKVLAKKLQEKEGSNVIENSETPEIYTGD